jgi:hypothetical protein
MTDDEKEFMEKPDLGTFSNVKAFAEPTYIGTVATVVPSKSTLQRELPILREKIRDSALKRWILSLDDATKMSVNLTDFTDVELAGLQYLLASWDIERLKKFKKTLEDRKAQKA